MPRIYFILISLLLVLVIYKSNYFFYPINEIEIISTEKKYNENNLDKYLNSIYEQDLLSIDIDEIKNEVISDVWIKDAQIIKSFPSKLTIKIIQYTPIALYNSNIMTSNGHIIRSTNYNNLPIILDYSADSTFAYDALTYSQNNIRKINLNIKKIEIFHSLIKIHTSNIVLISDKKKYKANLNRLIPVFDNIYKIFDNKISSIDMRYSNGFAIK